MGGKREIKRGIMRALGKQKKRAKRMSASLLSQQALLSFAALQDRRALLQTHIVLGSFTG
ncbi:hypothetical protein CF112_08660 [Aeromonas hydrophila]|jgi:hypothetical protein|nr:hypothetical protein CF112_08660 [Aeromonas hydrophila]